MKKWITLIASITLQTSLGMVYAWSTFVPALKKEHALDEAQAALVFGVCIAAFTCSMVLGGRLLPRFGPRKVGIAGGLLFLCGYLTGANSDGAFNLMLTGFGMIAGVGIGFCYVCPLTTAVQWFPKQKGFVTGLTVAGFGLGSVFFSRAGLWMLNLELPVLQVLLRIGLFIGVMVLISSLLLFLPENASGRVKENPKMPLSKIISNPDFRWLFFLIFCGTFGGLLVIGNLKPIGLKLGLTPAQATAAIMFFAVGNAAGRILWGLLYDRVGAQTIVWSMSLLAIGAAKLAIQGSGTLFYAATILIAFAFGGYFVLFAARVADIFGTHRIGDVYPWVFLGYGIAGLIGPTVGGWLIQQAEHHLFATLLVIAIALVGGLSAWRINRRTEQYV